PGRHDCLCAVGAVRHGAAPRHRLRDRHPVRRDSLGVVVLSLAAGPLRKRWRFSTVALGALMLSGALTVVFAAVPIYWVAVPLWGLISGLGMLFNINTGSLRQAIVPNHLLGRVISVAMVLAWSANPIGAVLGGLAIEWTHDVALIYAIVGVLTVLIPFCFSFTALGHAERYIDQNSATGFSAEPVPPAMTSGKTMSMNS